MCSEYTKTFGEDVVQLVNLKQVDEEKWTQYIGRKNEYYNLPQSDFANPYSLDDHDRQTAVRLYELWLFENLLISESFYEKFQSLTGEVLACWCLPELCHGDVLCNALVADENDELFSHINSRFQTLEFNLFNRFEEKQVVRDAIKDASSEPFN